MLSIEQADHEQHSCKQNDEHDPGYNRVSFHSCNIAKAGQVTGFCYIEEFDTLLNLTSDIVNRFLNWYIK